MFTRINRRGYVENVVEFQHLELDDLGEMVLEAGLENWYLDHPPKWTYPHPEIHVSQLRHDTDKKGLRGIRRDGGFRCPHEDDEEGLVWWSLDVGPEEIHSAETRLLESTFSHRTQAQAQMQWPFLEKFATSPAFLRSSRLGPHRFSFPLEEVLRAYSRQFCCGEDPIMRVYETVLYKQEVMYSVLVHSPANQERFNQYPLLDDDPDSVCTFEDGHFIWRPQAMCETHRYKLILKRSLKQMRGCFLRCRPKFYVWDNVAIAFHVDRQVLTFDADHLEDNLEDCEIGEPFIGRNGLR